MRRLKRLLSEQHGATAVVVGLLMIPLIALAGAGIDAGSLYWENAQLQNTADASAVAIAKHCMATNEAGTTSQAIANQLVTGNESAPSSAIVAKPFFGTSGTLAECGGGFTTVFAQRANSPHPLLSAFGLGTTPVTAWGSASWGSPSAATTTFPIAMAYCQFPTTALSNTSTVQLYKLNQSSGQSNGNGNGNGNGNSGNVTCPNGVTTYPGGFGWLSNNLCGVAAVDNNWVNAVPGNSPPQNCTLTIGQVALVPLYDGYQGTGANAQFHIYGFAALQIQGWTFPGNSSSNASSLTPSCQGSCNGIWGRFINFTFTGADVTAYGGPTTTGVSTVQAQPNPSPLPTP
ncbi:pilus assembly protein [Amnibacterium sp. CER49]|uniref:TadE/TadG family type IV pilus assembly protein n=1 Tax=Amnibacterium sp. CER49 TaxID=3039161 RepID=UPI00244CF548|nr:pilus assembly protein [Amnibacterium sp. CER49]MDH2444371.1 pilus assembly protein [Amnibacterium sp. CER49]